MNEILLKSKVLLIRTNLSEQAVYEELSKYPPVQFSRNGVKMLVHPIEIVEELK
jgi:hypothetical protein